MFDTVGRDRKQDRRQQAGSFLISLAINGGMIGGLIWAGATVAEEVVDDLPIEVTFFDAAPPPPPPPPKVIPKNPLPPLPEAEQIKEIDPQEDPSLLPKPSSQS